MQRVLRASGGRRISSNSSMCTSGMFNPLATLVARKNRLADEDIEKV